MRSSLMIPIVKGPGQKGELAFTTGEHGADAPAPGVIRNPAWSPDAKQLVYEKFAYDSDRKGTRTKGRISLYDGRAWSGRAGSRGDTQSCVVTRCQAISL